MLHVTAAAAAGAAAAERFDSAHKIEAWILRKFYENYAHNKWMAVAVCFTLSLSLSLSLLLSVFIFLIQNLKWKLILIIIAREKHNMPQLQSQTNPGHNNNYRPNLHDFPHVSLKYYFAQGLQGLF